VSAVDPTKISDRLTLRGLLAESIAESIDPLEVGLDIFEVGTNIGLGGEV
jgi:hypothetical protein